MCLSIPVKIISVNGNMAKVTAGGAVFDAGLHIIENAKVGDYVLLHAGFAIQKISRKEADKTLKLLKEMGNSFTI